MKVLFLDCDGVINCANTFKKGGDSYFPVEPYMAFLVGKIELDTECKVVLSSSWRHHPDSVEYIKNKIVPLYDLTGSEPIDPNRPRGIQNCQRGREIKAWLDKHPEVTKYAILDDENDMLPEQQDNFFKTSWLHGITEEIANKVISHLNENHSKHKLE